MASEIGTFKPQSTAPRLAELRETADRLDAEPRMRGEPPHGWVARAFLERAQADQEANRPAIAAVRLARLLLSGLIGRALSDEMRVHFGTVKQASRADYILAIGIAAADWEAERTELLATIAVLQRDLVAAKAPRAA